MQSYANWYDKTHPSDQHKRCMDTAMRMSEYTEMYRKKYEARKIEKDKIELSVLQPASFLLSNRIL